MNYEYKPLPVVAFQVNKDTKQMGQVPPEFMGAVQWTGEGMCLKDGRNPQVLKPLKEGDWVVRDVTTNPQNQIYSDFKFNQRFQRHKKDGTKK